MRQRERWRGLGKVGAVLLSALLLGGCSRWLDAKAGAAVTASLRSLERQDNREVLQKLLTSQEVEASTKALSQAVLDTAWDDLSRDERRARAKELTAELVEATGPAFARVLDRDVLPRVRAELSTSLEAAVQRAFSDENRRRAEDFASGVARKVLASTQADITRTLREGLAEGVAEGIGRSVDTRVVPAVNRALNGGAPGFARALRSGTEGALLGAADALHGELGAVLRQDRQDFLRELQGVAAAERQAWVAQLRSEAEAAERRWRRWFWMLAAIGGIALLAGAVFLSLLLRENRRLKAA